MRAEFLPFSRPTIGEEEIAEVVDSLRSGWITTGPKVARFEAAFRERLGVKHAIAVNSATAGLHLAIASLNLGPEDEVLVPSLTWASTANVVELSGARVQFVDCDPATLCMDPEDARRRITPRTRAMIPVHFAGEAADLDALRALAKEHDLVLIHDAAHALGTFHKGEEIGSSGELTVFSFHPIKNITTGEGGMIVLDDDALADRIRLLRFHGVSKDAWSRYRRGDAKPHFDVLEPGFKYNLPDLLAALGLHQLVKLEGFNARRKELAERYGRLLAAVPGVTPLSRAPYPTEHAWHLYVVRLEDEVTLGRDDLMQALEKENVGTGLHFPALHMMSYYRERYGFEPGSLPHSERAGERILSLPLYPLMSDADQDDVVEALTRLLTAQAVGQ